MTYFEHKAVSSGAINIFAQTPYEPIVKDAGHFYETIPNTYLVYVLSAKAMHKIGIMEIAVWWASLQKPLR